MVNRPQSIPFEKYLPIFEQGRALYRGGGVPRGQSTGWPSLDPFYTVALGQWTVITGIPGSGKSEFIDAMCVNLAEAENWLFAVYSPENCPTAGHLIKLVEKRIRKPFNVGLRERMTEQEYELGSFWVMDRFMWLSPELKTPDKLLRTAIDYRREGRKLGVILDPWNTLEHDRGLMTETDYTSFILAECIKLCRAANCHVWLVVHPAKMLRNRDGSRPIPGPYDISGSAHWYNKPDNILCIHRDQATADSRQDVDIHIQKVRHKWSGHVGLITLKYDRATGRYFEVTHAVPNEQYADPEAGATPPAAIQTREREPGEDDE